MNEGAGQIRNATKRSTLRYLENADGLISKETDTKVQESKTCHWWHAIETSMATKSLGTPVMSATSDRRTQCRPLPLPIPGQHIAPITRRFDTGRNAPCHNDRHADVDSAP